MHNIKYFFLNKINQTIQRDGITEKHYFSKSRGAPPDTHRIRPGRIYQLNCWSYISRILGRFTSEKKLV
jgi:hypothetical protein